jgi:hypothetical protein
MIKLSNKIRVLSAVFMLFSYAATAQNYRTSIGIRFGGLTNGLTVKHFTRPNIAIEGILSTAYHGTLITGLYEKQATINNDAALKLVYGIGGHLGFFNNGGYYNYHKNRYYNTGVRVTIIGVDAIVGFEYKFKNAPITAGIDLKPFIDFSSGLYVYVDGGVSIRYAF